MAQTPYSLLLLRRLSRCSPNPKPPPSLLSIIKPFSTSTSATPISSSDPKPSSLSARLSFVFDQIDAIEKERSEKDHTLQKIRAWRESKKPQIDPPELGLEGVTNDNANDASLVDSGSAERRERPVAVKKAAEVVHPWPEWIELMERLVQQNYFDHRRVDEDKMVQDIGFDASEAVLAAEEDAPGVDFKDYKAVHTACLNFGKDRFDIMRSLSRQDIQLLVGFGCASTDKKVVFSSKLLRKHTHLDEGDVCSSCSLRNSCERAYLITNKEDEARTIDIMRVLFAYGFDPVNGTVVNKSLLKQKSVKTVVRKLLHQVVKLSSVPIDPNLPPPVIKKPPPKVKQPPPPPRRRVGRDDIEMKKGDWLCSKCDFMNFAKNTICLQCDAKRPKRQLLPGEWECPGCNFLNYRRNMACFHCDCKRPPDEYVENKVQEKQRGPRTRMEKTAVLHGDSNAWNFDFDDNESDGADVATFERADSLVMGEGSLGNQAPVQNFGRPEYGFSKDSKVPRVHNEEYSDADTIRPGRGFDDFDDEDDDIDNYELDTRSKNSSQKASIDFSEFEGSESEDDEGSDNSLHGRHRTKSPTYNKQSKSTRQRPAFSVSDDDELDVDSGGELSVHPNWKSSHVADSRSRGRGRNTTGPTKGLSFGSDDELGLSSDVDDDLDQNFGSGKGKLNKMHSGRKDFQRRGSFGMEDDSVSGSESDDDFQSHKNRPRRNTENNFKGRSSLNFTKDTQFESNGMKGGMKNSFHDDFDRSTRGSRGNDRGFRGSDFDGQRKSSRGGGRNSFNDDFDGQRKSSRGGGRNSFNDEFDGQRKSSRGGGRNSFNDDFDGQRMSNRGGDRQSFKGPKRGGFGKGAGRNSFNDDFDSSSRGSRGNSKGFRGNDFDGERMSNRGSDTRNFRGSRREGFGKQQRGRANEYGRDKDRGPDDFSNSRRVIER